MSRSSAVVSSQHGPLRLDDSESRSQVGAVQAPSAAELLGFPTMFFEIDIFQTDTDTSSLDRFVAKIYEQIPSVLAIHRSFEDQTTRYFIIAKDDEEVTMESIFEPEKFFYSRFQGDRLDFQVLPGSDLEYILPSAAKLVWQR